MELARKGDRYCVRRALVNRNPDQYRAPVSCDQAYEVALLRFLVHAVLLGRPAKFPLPANLSEETPKGLYQQHVCGTGFPERKIKPWWKFW